MKVIIKDGVLFINPENIDEEQELRLFSYDFEKYYKYDPPKYVIQRPGMIWLSKFEKK